MKCKPTLIAVLLCANSFAVSMTESRADCPAGFVPNSVHFADPSFPCIRQTQILTPTPGYQIGDYIWSYPQEIRPGFVATIQRIYRNGALVRVEALVEGIVIPLGQYQPDPAPPPPNPSLATTYVRPEGGAYNPQTGQLIEATPCYRDPDQQRCQ